MPDIPLTSRFSWPGPAVGRVGLGCMRLSDAGAGGEAAALETIGAAVGAGIRIFESGHAYGPDASAAGHNERLLAQGLFLAGAAGTARVVTKGGMRREGQAWIPDGRARTIRADFEASATAFGGMLIDLFLLHAPDPRVSWRTSVRAIGSLKDAGMVAAVGLCNVNRDQLDDALELVAIDAVEVAINPFDDVALRSGVVARCLERGVTVIAHSPLGGPRRHARLVRDPLLAGLAAEIAATPAEVALAWLLDLSPGIVVIPGARRPAAARSAAAAGGIRLDRASRERLQARFGSVSGWRRSPVAGAAEAEVHMLMGIPGAGKTRLAAVLAGGPATRLNRDQRGGSLRAVAADLDALLAAGTRSVLLDNTYLTRAARDVVLEVAARHLVPVRCSWLDTPLAEAQVNLVHRLLDHFGYLPTPEELRAAARQTPGLLTPTAQMRALRELEPPRPDEGFAEVRRVPFVRVGPGAAGGAGVFVAASAVRNGGIGEVLAAGVGQPHLVFDWLPGGGVEDLEEAARAVAAEIGSSVDLAVCTHPAGPPTCWCRPPLPGLPLAFARRLGVDPAASSLVGTSTAHLALAGAIGARYVGLKTGQGG